LLASAPSRRGARWRGRVAENPAFSDTRLLLSVVAVDTLRNITENIYFGVYFGGQSGMFPAAVVGVLGRPTLLIVSKILNVVAGCVVLGLLLLRWLPSAVREHMELENNAKDARSLSGMMDEFVANVSHELRTPLTSIAGSLGLWLRELSDNCRQLPPGWYRSPITTRSG
jgi:signal transduction histidine kinase